MTRPPPAATPEEMGIADVAPLLEQLVAIGAPTGNEKRRARFVADWLSRQGVPDVRMDEVDNVYIRIGPPGAALMLDAHTDTVFPDETFSVDRREDGRWFCPGVMDNTVHCALLMVYLRYLTRKGNCPIPLLGSFTVGEEGRGDLRGIKAMMEAQRAAVRWVIALDLNREYYTRRCVGSTRFEVTFHATGGHSWNNFGQPSAIHAAARWIARLETLADWTPGTLSYNVGVLSGGSGVTAIASQAQLQLDLRSVNPKLLEQVESVVVGSLHELAEAPGDLKVQWRDIGRRPAGELPADHPLVEMVQTVHRRLDLPLEESARSTNANWPTHLGIPAICTGLIRGGGVHTRGEFLDTTTLPTGLSKLAAIVDAVAAHWKQP